MITGILTKILTLILALIVAGIFLLFASISLVFYLYSSIFEPLENLENTDE